MATTFVGASAVRQASPASAGQSTIALFGRVLIAMLFVLSGLEKIIEPSATLAYIHAAGLPFAPLALAGSTLIELGGGAALILGYRTRYFAALLMAFSLVTAWVFHSDLVDQNQMIHFLKNFAIAGGLLQVAAFGGGQFSLDARGGR